MGLQVDMEPDKMEYVASHPWISFRLDVSKASWTFWEQIGGGAVRARHLSRTPLPPDLARKMERLYLARGAQATTAIEGNTLSEEQALAVVEGTLHLPQSQQYLQQELENIIRAVAAIEREIYDGSRFEIAPERLRELNRMVLSSLEVDDHVVPGELRTASVVVGGVYRGAPARDCEYLLASMCDWLEGPDFRGVMGRTRPGTSCSRC